MTDFKSLISRGDQQRIADHLKIVPSAVSQWKRVPAERVLEVERVTGISRHTLRPDIYGFGGE